MAAAARAFFDDGEALLIHEAVPPSAGAPAGLFKLRETRPSVIEARDRKASIQPGQLVSATSSDMVRQSAASEVTEGHMGWRKGPPLGNGPEDVSLLLRTSGPHCLQGCLQIRKWSGVRLEKQLQHIFFLSEGSSF